jgi:chemotaxis response regulator CheB
MNTHLKHLPAILLITKDQRDRMPEKEWLKQSRFRTWEAMNVFDALEGMTDFTLKNRPDVVVLNVESMRMEFELVLGLLLNGTANESEFPIFVLSGEPRMIRNDDVFEGDFTEIVAQLEELVPQTGPQVH